MRAYRLGKRQATVDRTEQDILAAARDLVAAGPPPSLAQVARRAGVSRITIYNRFGSRERLLGRLDPRPDPPELSGSAPPRQQLRVHLQQTCARWAASPALYRNLEPRAATSGEVERRLAERLAEADDLRPGCSIKEAEDVIGMLTSFAAFDRLHRDGRRPAAAVAEMLMRLASAVLA